MTGPARPGTFRLVPAHVTGKTHIAFLLFFLPGEPDFFRVNDNHKISGVDVRRENGLFFPTQQIGSLHCNASQYLVLGVDDPPVARDFGGFLGKRFHGAKKSPETTGNGTLCQPTEQWDLFGTYG